MMMKRDKFCLLLIGLCLSACLVSVTGFAPTRASEFRSTSALNARRVTEVIRATEVISSKADQEEKRREKKKIENPFARATRTLYKPRATEVIGVSDAELLKIEREIQESTKARLDVQRVEAMLEDDMEAEERTTTSDWEVSMAAGGVAGVVAFATTDNLALASIALVGVFLLANGDPLEEQTPAGEYC